MTDLELDKIDKILSGNLKPEYQIPVLLGSIARSLARIATAQERVKEL